MMISELVSRETIVTIAPVYLVIGCLHGVAISGAGLIQDALRQNYSKTGIALALIEVICGWPIIACVMVARIFEGLRR